MQLRKRNLFDVLETLDDLKAKTDNTDVVAKNILVRVDFNVPMNASDGSITDDSRIRGALPTIKAIMHSKNNAILVSHMGRPKLVQKAGNNLNDDPATMAQRSELSLRPVAARLSGLLETAVIFGDDCLGDSAKEAIDALPTTGGGICLLENLRFYPQEEANDTAFSQKLASYADAYINDAFGTCHRAHASTAGIPASFADSKQDLCGIGSLVASELNFLDFSRSHESDKIAAVIGGSKVSTKLPVIRGLLQQVDTLILGGGLAFTFLKAQGVAVGNSLVEESMLDTALELIQEAKEQGKTLVIPVDAVCSQSFPQGAMKKEDTKTFDLVPGGGIDDGWMGLDVGPKTVADIKSSLDGVSKIVMNGKSRTTKAEAFHPVYRLAFRAQFPTTHCSFCNIILLLY